MCSGQCSCKRGATDDAEVAVNDWRYRLQQITIVLFSISALGCWISGFVLFERYPTMEKVKACLVRTIRSVSGGISSVIMTSGTFFRLSLSSQAPFW